MNLGFPDKSLSNSAEPQNWNRAKVSVPRY